MSKVSKDLTTAMMKLTSSQPWLFDKVTSVVEIMEECETQEQQKLLLDMLHRFSYMDEGEYSLGLKSIVTYLFGDCGLKPSETQLYGLQIARDTDSSNEVAYRIRTKVNREIGGGLEHFSTMNRIPEISISERPSLVLVDEFIGSGKTADIRLAHLFNRSKDLHLELDPSNVYLCYLAGMRSALEFVRNSYPVNVFCYRELEKGIEGYYHGDSRTDAYSNMHQLETNLCDPCPESHDPLPYLGYGSAESLYYREEGNPPNSNFPIFWWNYRKTEKGDAAKRSVLFRRAV